MITQHCNRQEGNLEGLVLIREEIAGSCGQKDSPKPILASQKNKYVAASTSEKKTLAKYSCRKVQNKPITLEEVFSSHSNLQHFCNCFLLPPGCSTCALALLAVL